MRGTRHLLLGKLGEMRAREYLERKGYKILEQNYKTRRAEIDIVARKGSTLVIVEVRSTADEKFGMPEETLGPRKKRRLLWNAKAYVARKRYKELYRIDAICVVFRGDGSDIPMRLTHYENILT
ncbi:MAG: hypothetical protein A2842_00945 [Candidatus Wildermuthbacteria bacterium RIFCSPHIGHO2_01_FULL_48_25]|nr:MAG: hypothetical protein A2842_00945 [Candidatus Wildermuthbacteria bacterium RIFCSPHIGHO2_01_FULL_48_25]